MADTDLVDGQLERIAVERISLGAYLLPIRHAMSRIRINAICRSENERNDRDKSQRLESKVNAVRSWILPAPIEVDVHVEAIASEAKAVSHLNLNDGGQIRRHIEDSAVCIDKVISIAVAVLCCACLQVVLRDYLATICPYFPGDLPHMIAGFVNRIDSTNGCWNRACPAIKRMSP